MADAPAVIAPSPGAMDYQWPNAEVYASAGAATIVDETKIQLRLMMPLSIISSRYWSMMHDVRMAEHATLKPAGRGGECLQRDLCAYYPIRQAITRRAAFRPMLVRNAVRKSREHCDEGEAECRRWFRHGATDQPHCRPKHQSGAPDGVVVCNDAR
jgi:hypothetical protein